MAWEGYLTYGGVEIINVARTETYLANTPLLTAFRPAYTNIPLADYLEDSYGVPSDGAPWYNENFPETGEFYGVYPLSVTGLENSTATAVVVENTGDGGYIQTTRQATKGIVFNTLLLGADSAACAAGLRWLEHVLLNRTSWNPVTDGQPGLGNDLAFLVAPPEEGDLVGVDPLDRQTYFDSRCTIGPTVLAKTDLNTCGGTVWNVQFTITAPNPKPFFDPIGVVTDYPTAVPTSADPFDNEVDGTDFDAEDALFAEVSCAVELYQPLNDPLCPAAILPPGVPSVPLNCVSLPLTFRRRWLQVPKGFAPTHSVAAGVINIDSRDGAPVRNYRLRFYPYTDSDPTPDLGDPCAFAYEILVPYLPVSITINTHLAEVVGPGNKRAEHMLTRTDGTPFDWPWLDADLNWGIAVDHDASYVEPYLTIDYLTTNSSHGII